MDILIAENDAAFHQDLTELLTRHGHTVLPAATGRSAWDIFQTSSIRMVIMGWRMPEMTGMELCQRIRSARKAHYTYIIVITDRNAPSDTLKILESGADDHMFRPVDFTELQARINAGRRIMELEDNYQALQHCLIESRNKLRIVLDSLPQEIVSIDTNSCIVSANKAFLQGKSEDFTEIVGTPCFDTRHWNMPLPHITDVQTHALDVFYAGTPRFVYETIRNRNRQIRHIEFHLLPIREDSGSVQQVVIVAKDITEDQQRSERIKSLNRELQQAVDEVQEKNRELLGTLDRLRETQSLMVQSEKMASIGQLAAGVAHEINNPVGFVSSNLKTLADYQQDIGEMIRSYQEFVSQTTDPAADALNTDAITCLAAQIRENESRLDIPYILEDVPDLIRESREGLDRIKKIVLDLKNFSHPGEDVLKLTDINQNLDSTLNIVWNEIKYKATVTRDYGPLPQVKCYPQQLNQVLMNLLVNAAQAIEKQGQIHIRTRRVGDQVQIAITDTGQGIPEKNLSRIFDPFFTTKPVGKGTGLGLNVTYNIIKKHQGTIDVQSEPGKGTTFTVCIPVDGASSPTKEIT
jgi:PAS domain S-box-containing protein